MNAAAAEVLPAEPTSAPSSSKSVATKRMTFEEWANMAEDEPGEFVNGELESPDSDQKIDADED